MDKQYLLGADDIRPLAMGHGACLATDRITIEGLPVRFMYREEPDNDVDSGWRFFSGTEDDDYMNDPDNHGVYDVNVIANYDKSIIAFLDSAIGCVFEKIPGARDFAMVENWSPGDEQ